MRRFPVALAVTALAGAVLVGCSAPAETACPTPSAPAGVFDGVTVTGSTDDAPEASIAVPFHTDETVATTIEPGDGEGAPIISADQLAVLDITVFSGETGEQLVATAYSGDLSTPFALSQWEQTFPGFADALHCAGEGSRIAVALSPDGVAEEQRTGLGLTEGESAVAVVDVRKTYLTAADGADRFVEGHGLPTVVRDPEGHPGVIVPDGDAPTEAAAEVLKEGDGPTVSADAPARVHLLAVDWDTKEELASTTWGAEPRAVSLDELPIDFADALDGATVGSQLLIVLPPGEDTGSESAVVYVVDILGIDATS